MSLSQGPKGNLQIAQNILRALQDSPEFCEECDHYEE
jgi:hypothetical protein